MELDEFEVIQRYFAGLTAPRRDIIRGIGDDAAVLDLPPDHELVAATDTLVAGVHFSEGAAPFDIGFKALAVNLSDMAAMAGEPKWATLALTLPRADAAWLEAFARGFADLAARHEVGLVGGDLTRGPLTVTVQILGVVPRGRALYRGTARPGDRIYVTGELGSAGLALAASGKAAIDGADIPAFCIERLHRPEPRVGIGRCLRGLASAAIDISDGLLGDLQHVVQSSGVGAEVELAKLPMCSTLRAVRDADARWRIALCAGDDYELCFTIPPGRGAELSRALEGVDPRVTEIGCITAGRGIHWILPDGSSYQPRASAYRHF